jgi:hypothetical protein
MVSFPRYLDLQFDQRPSYYQNNNVSSSNNNNNNSSNYIIHYVQQPNNVSLIKLSSENNVHNTISTNHRNTSGNNAQNYGGNNDSVTLMIGLSGEFGNHLDKMIRGWGIARLAKEEYNITSHIILKQQTLRGSTRPMAKSHVSQQYLQRCFQHLKNEDFELGNKILQNYKGTLDEPKTITFDGSIETIREKLSNLKNYLNTSNIHNMLSRTQNDSQDLNFPNLPPTFVVSNDFEGDPFVDQYYDEIRQLFVFNNSVCCTEFPDPDESVFVSSVLIFVFMSALCFSCS